MTEEWRAIPGFPGYQVSSLGRVQSFKRGGLFGKILSPSVSKRSGRSMVTMHMEGKPHWRLVARLVCQSFHGAPPTKRHQAAHGDGNTSNDTKENLSWKTPKENCEDRTRHGRTVMGTKHHAAILTERKVIKIREKHAAMKTAGNGYGANKSLAEKYGVSIWVIEDVVYRRKWRHI